MPALTVSDIDDRLEQMRRIAKDVTRPVEDRALARRMLDAYLDRRNQVTGRG